MGWAVWTGAAARRQMRERRSDSTAVASWTNGDSGHGLTFLNRTLFGGVPIPPLEVEIAA